MMGELPKRAREVTMDFTGALPRGRLVARLTGFILVIAGWYVLAWFFPENLMPYPLETVALTVDLITSGVVLPNLQATMIRTLFGFLGAMVLGLAVGILMGLNNYSMKFLNVYVVVGISLPAIALAAITTLVFGFSLLAPVTATVLATFPYVAVNVWKGVENIETDLVEMSSSFGVSRRRMLFRLIIPNTAPDLFTAFRFGLALSWRVVTIAEIFASSNGIGYKIINTYHRYQFEEAWAWALIFMSVILFIEYAIFKPLERRAFAYRPEADFSLL